MTTYTHLGEHCWTMPVSSDECPESDDVHDPSASRLILSEDGRDLGPAHSPIDLVRQNGGGLFSHWQNVLYFSTSDNSDPTTNGRDYRTRWDASEYFQNAANYTLAVLDGWLKCLGDGPERLRGRKILEIGPGRSMGTVAAMAALGGQILAVDRFCGDWQEDWHEGFLCTLQKSLLVRDWPIDPSVIDRILAYRSFAVEPITVETRPIEVVGGEYKDFADLTFSHSTFEHFYSVGAAAQSMAQISAVDSIGVHDVDFRDHRNFGTPLEFLTVPDEEYERPETNDFYGRGNRVRPDEMQAIFERSGFSNVSFTGSSEADPAYLSTFELRLREAEQSAFRHVPRGSLRTLSGTFVIKA